MKAGANFTSGQGAVNTIERVSEKWEPVFRKRHATIGTDRTSPTARQWIDRPGEKADTLRRAASVWGIDAMTAYRLLQILLVAFGAVFCLIWPLAIVWPSGWMWHEGPATASQYYIMIVGVYATLGLFMIAAARDPLKHVSLIWFVAASSAVHAAIMAVQSFSAPMHRGHLLGDVPALLLVTVAFAVLLPKAQRSGG